MTEVMGTAGTARTARTEDVACTQVHLRAHIDSLSSVSHKLDNACVGLHGLADRLLGGQPEDDSNKVPCSVPEGIIAECQDRVEVLSVLADKINFALTRLDQVA